MSADSMTQSQAIVSVRRRHLLRTSKRGAGLPTSVEEKALAISFVVADPGPKPCFGKMKQKSAKVTSITNAGHPRRVVRGAYLRTL